MSTAQWRSLNLTKGTGDDPAVVEENLRRTCAALGLRRADLVSPNQRHTANVRRVGAADRGRIWPGYDTLITDEPGVPLLLRYADCTPVLIYDPAHHALALIHSGWRGTVQGAGRVAVEALVAEYGSRPAEMIAAIGPSIGPCCYEVGEDVIDAVHAAFDRPAELLPNRNGSGPRGRRTSISGRRTGAGWSRPASDRSRPRRSVPPAGRTTSTRTAPSGGRRGISGR